MEKRLNVNLTVKERLDSISEAFKIEETDSSTSILEELNRLRVEAKRRNIKIKPGMLVYSNGPQTINPFYTSKRDSCVLSQSEVQSLKEIIDLYLQQEDGRKLLLFEDL